MKSGFRLLAVGAFAATLPVAATGCEAHSCETDDGRTATCFSSLVEYKLPSDPAPEVIAWESGDNVTVKGVRGDITVRQGMANEVKVQFIPYNFRSHQKEDEARVELDQYLTTRVTEDATTGTVLVETLRDDRSNDGLGADIEIALPPDFDGTLDLFNDGDGRYNAGNILVDFVGLAPRVDVLNDFDSGSCTLHGAPTLKTTIVGCGSDILVTNVSDTLGIEATGLLSDVTVMLAGISRDAANSQVTNEHGDIDITFPADAAFQARAQGAEGIDTGVLPNACSESLEAANTLVTCVGDGTVTTVPVYNLVAGGQVIINYATASP